MASNEYDDCPANSSAGCRTDEAPDLKLIGNFFPDSIGVPFPKEPPITYSSESIVTPMFQPATQCVSKRKEKADSLSLLTELSSNGFCDSKYEIRAAPGIPPIPKAITGGENAHEFGTGRIRYYQWYWNRLIQAIQPVEKHVPEYGKLKLMNGTVYQISPTWDRQENCAFEKNLYVLDNDLQADKLTDEEKTKLKSNLVVTSPWASGKQSERTVT
ncbi:hypothetical protein HA402_005610 [Bradysia odoriphaga]|nr:hypothetical protein HA402_005610 [Bradysia odoriphaga]